MFMTTELFVWTCLMLVLGNIIQHLLMRRHYALKSWSGQIGVHIEGTEPGTYKNYSPASLPLAYIDLKDGSALTHVLLYRTHPGFVPCIEQCSICFDGGCIPVRYNLRCLPGRGVALVFLDPVERPIAGEMAYFYLHLFDRHNNSQHFSLRWPTVFSGQHEKILTLSD